MGGAEKWSVTYTKHIKQKRKVYQDGFLELDALSHKVILYDDCENILTSRFVKKDDIIEPGETLVFDCYFVDIGDLHGDRKPVPKFNTKVTMASKSFQNPKFGNDTAAVNRKPNLGMDKVQVTNLSPSQKIIREFKKSEMTKYGSSPGCSDTTNSSKMEWQVLYTTQITQKAKKYHDGILLLINGSQKQILLHDANRRLLDSRFLKKDEVIRSGESITFDGHLVDVRECEGDNKPLMDLNLEERNCNEHGKTRAGREDIHSQNKFPVGEFENSGSSWKPTYSSDRHSCVDNIKLSQRVLTNKPVSDEPQKEDSPRKHLSSNIHSSSDKYNIPGLGVGKKPVRAALEILSILKKPMTQKDAANMERQSVEGSYASQSSHVYNLDTGNHIEQQSLQDFCPEGRTVVELNEENSTMHKERRSERISKNLVDIGCTNRSDIAPDPPTIEPKLLIPVELDLKGQQLVYPESQDWSTEILEKGHCTKPLSSREDPIGAIPAAYEIAIPFFEEVEPKNVTKPYADGKQLDARWDDGVHVIDMEKSNDCNSHGFCDAELKI